MNFEYRSRTIRRLWMDISITSICRMETTFRGNRNHGTRTMRIVVRADGKQTINFNAEFIVERIAAEYFIAYSLIVCDDAVNESLQLRRTEKYNIRIK